jgi:hypothetical protein
MRACLLLTAALAALAAGFAPAPFPRTSRHQETDSVYGQWDFTLWEMSGRRTTVSQYLDFEPGKVHFVSIQGGHKVTYDLVVRQDLAPRGFQWKVGGNGGWIGSYRLEKDVLTLIFKSGAQIEQRPTDFAGGQHEYRFVLKRWR